MQRPSKSDDNVLNTAITALIPSLRLQMDPNEGAPVSEHLFQAMKFTAPLFEGWEIAEYLERRCHWSTEEANIDDLDVTYFHVHTAWEDVVKAWVIRENIVPRQSLNDVVQITIKGKVYEGTVLRIDVPMAQYVVQIPALGHGAFEAGCTTQGLVVFFEDLHSIVAPPEEFELLPS